VVVYETMWGATEKMARKIVEGLASEGVEVKLYDAAGSDRTEIITQMLSAKGFIFGSSTHDNDMLPNIAAFLEMVKGLKTKGIKIGFFGSYGWAGGAIKEMQEMRKDSAVDQTIPGVSCKYTPDSAELVSCFEFGSKFAQSLR